jgi:hypothetical protein
MAKDYPMMPNQSPERTAVGAGVLLSRFTSRVGGGSAFYVRPLHSMRDQNIEDKKDGVDPLWILSILRDIAVLVAFSWSSVFIVGFIIKKVLQRQPHADFFGDTSRFYLY